MNRRHTTIFITVFILAVSLPYLVAFSMGGDQFVFSGFLFNPIDGSSYLAKMQQGWAGEWNFTLPYTLEQGEGAPLFLLYLFLGHLSRWLQLPLVLTFHLARLAGTVVMLLALKGFCEQSFPMGERAPQKALILAAFGSGLGWIAFLSGAFTADFWVAEAYPFLSAFANPHFPLGLALLLTIFTLANRDREPKTILVVLVLAGLLALIQPFGIVVASVVLGGKLVWEWFADRVLIWQAVLAVLVGGGLLLLYQFWVIRSDPMLAGWDAQNVTPAPTLPDILVSLSPALLLGGYWLIKNRATLNDSRLRIPILWLAASLALLYFPFNLQRRFMLGVYIPVSILAVMGTGLFQPAVRKRVWAALFGLSIITNVIVLAATLFGAAGRDPALYLYAGEQRAMEWIRLETAAGSGFLASPETGQWIPAYTGRRVVYGHPYETLHADSEEETVLAFYRASSIDSNQLANLHARGVDYIFYGPREQLLGSPSGMDVFPIVYDDGEVTIYRIEGQ